MPKGVYKNKKAALAKRAATIAAKKAAQAGEQEIPLDAIPMPERRPVAARRRSDKGRPVRGVHVEYHVGDDTLVLVMGRRSLPFKVVP